MAKKSKSRRRVFFKKITHRAKKMTIPLAVVAGLAPGIITTANAVKFGGWSMAGQTITGLYTGFDYNGKFQFSRMNQGLIPVLGGVAIHKLASMLGVNKMIAGAGIPFVRI